MAAATEVSLEIIAFNQAQTIVRTRGELAAFFDLSGSSAGDACVLGIGLMIGSSGATIARSSIDEADYSWLWHKFVPLSTETVIGGAASDWGPLTASVRIEIDSKAMRRVKFSDLVFMVMETSSVSGAPIVNVVGGVRTLSAL